MPCVLYAVHASHVVLVSQGSKFVYLSPYKERDSMEKGIKTMDGRRGGMGKILNKPNIYDEYYMKVRNSIDALIVKGKGVVLIKGDNMCYVDGVKVEDGRLIRK